MRGSIASEAYDRLWFGPGAAVASVAFVAAGWALGPGATLALYLTFNALFNLPHQFCTWARAFGEEGPVPRWRWAAVMLGVAILVVLARAIPIGQAVFLTNVLPYWGLWHLCSQHFGITRIYRRKVPRDVAGVGFDRGFFVALFALGLVRAHAATDLTFRVRESVTAMWRLPIPPAWGPTISAALAVAFVGLAAARFLTSYRSNGARARFEGLVAAATFAGFFGTDEIMITTAAITSLHNLHYIGLVRFYRATRARLDPGTRPLGLGALALAYGYSAAVHAVFLVSAFAGEALLATLVASHYVIDGAIWRFRKAPALATYLGL